jgi:hypothetical protein
VTVAQGPAGDGVCQRTLSLKINFRSECGIAT